MSAFRGVGTIVIVFLAAATALALPQRGVNQQPDDPAVVARFEAAVGEYLRTHRFTDPIDLQARCLPGFTARASAILLDEPPVPQEGGLFTPEVVALLRARIAALALPESTSRTRMHPVAVGQPLATGRNARLPTAIAGVLPPLPEDLDYRLVGADLILADLRTNVVVDALRQWREP